MAGRVVDALALGDGMTPVSVIEVLRAARDRVLTDESRWIKGIDWESVAPEDKRVCAVNAAARGQRVFNESMLIRDDVYDALHDALPAGFCTIPSFNDHPDTTFSDVIDLFDRAIKGLEDPSSARQPGA